MKTHPLKCRIQAAAKSGGVTRVDIYDDIGGGDSFFGPTGISAQAFAQEIGDIKGDIDVHINSAGGDVFDGIAISNAINGHHGFVSTVVDGLAASIASVIAQSGRRRTMQAGSMMMIHDAMGGSFGNEDEMRKMASTLSKVSDNLAAIYANRSKRGTADSWRASMKEETWYTAEEAVVAGLADAIGEDQAQLLDGMDLADFSGVPDRIAARLVTLQKPKTRNRALAVHHTDTVDTTWDGGKAKKGFASKADVLQYCYAWEADAEGDDESKKSNYKFPHHMTKGGPANLAACRNGLARLSGAKIPDSDKAGVEAHLRAHLKDSDAEDAENALDYFIGKYGHGGKLVVVDAIPAMEADRGKWNERKVIKAALKSEDPEKFFRAVCAGRKSGDPALAASWALPYRYTPTSKPNVEAITYALARLAIEPGLTNADQARETLTDLMQKIEPGFASDAIDPKLLAAVFAEGLKGA